MPKSNSVTAQHEDTARYLGLDPTSYGAHWVICPMCRGKGLIVAHHKCRDCDSSGVVWILVGIDLAW